VRSAEALRGLVSVHEEKRDFILLGAYAAGSDAVLDRAVAAMPAIERLLRQPPDALETFATTVYEVERLAKRYQPAPARGSTD
jgi:flagellar biosynthesis/type III secretory pathway ATPase